ncbi:MAG TPA: HAMP domain-containing sensor histidine kinase, partial [Gemmatimonadales bacterium]|nr:HAMP domain-containing sensor histidine kinase [Gemmatimonadales bacterium]
EILRGKADLLDPEGKEVLDFLTGDVHRFARLVQDLLETSRIDAGAVNMRQEEVRLSSYIREVVDRRSGRPVTVSAGENARTMIDRRLMDRVIENLLDNAERYGRGVTRVSVEHGDGVARLLVDDAGPGVPPELRERIFERFARISAPLPEGADPGGAGLGLALVAENVRLHGGRVWVEDSPDGGARFVVQLPLEMQ